VIELLTQGKKYYDSLNGEAETGMMDDNFGHLIFFTLKCIQPNLSTKFVSGLAV
jgi:hypothetical protein